MNNTPGATGSLIKRKYFYIILPTFAGSVIAYLDRINIAYAALTMNEDLGFSAQIFGMGAGIFFFGYVLFEVPGALIAERWSPRIWIARIMITWGIISCFMAFIQNAWQFYLVRFLLGAAEASFYPVVYASIIPRWFTPEERPRAIALMLASLQVSAIIGSPLAGWLLGVHWFAFKGWQLLFILEAIPAVIFGILVLFWLSDWPAEVSWLTSEEKQYLMAQYEQERVAKEAVRQYTVWQALRDWEVLKLCLIYFLWITGYWGFNYWMPTVLKEVSGWSNLAIGWLIVIPMFLSLIAMIYAGISSSKTGEKRWHGAVPLFIGAVGMGIGTFISNPSLNFIFVIITAIGVYSAFGVWWSYPTTFLSGMAAAGAVGLINSFGNVGGYVGPYLTGFVKTMTGSFHWAYVYLACSLAAAGVLMLTLKRR
ncbi:MAG: MFS transporter [Proteobacteria bacterium]|nr:MFS transporter [Pseudomonadota bacterium]